MREIKFRGTRIDNGEWAFGNLLVEGKKCWIGSDSDGWVYVHPETVGQFTGLLDKNGKEIYEGDVVRFVDCGGEAYITFLQQEMAFVLVHKTHDSRLGHRNRGGSYFQDETLEIIGNIHEAK